MAEEAGLVNLASRPSPQTYPFFPPHPLTSSLVFRTTSLSQPNPYATHPIESRPTYASSRVTAKEAEGVQTDIISAVASPL
jgi:hypothetical protein